MDTRSLIAAVDVEIERLNQVKNLLTGGSSGPSWTPKPKGKKRNMSPEARKRIGDAQRKRWAKQKAAAKKAE